MRWSISTVEVSVRGVRSPVLTAGPPEGAEAVVFVHGNPGPADDWRELLTTLINTGVLIDYRWHHYARIWRTPGLGEVFQATASRPAFRMLLGRENPRLTRDQIDRIYDASRPWATKRAVLKLYGVPVVLAEKPTDIAFTCASAERLAAGRPEICPLGWIRSRGSHWAARIAGMVGVQPR